MHLIPLRLPLPQEFLHTGRQIVADAGLTVIIILVLFLMLFLLFFLCHEHRTRTACICVCPPHWRDIVLAVLHPYQCPPASCAAAWSSAVLSSDERRRRCVCSPTAGAPSASIASWGLLSVAAPLLSWAHEQLLCAAESIVQEPRPSRSSRSRRRRGLTCFPPPLSSATAPYSAPRQASVTDHPLPVQRVCGALLEAPPAPPMRRQ